VAKVIFRIRASRHLVAAGGGEAAFWHPARLRSRKLERSSFTVEDRYDAAAAARVKPATRVQLVLLALRESFSFSLEDRAFLCALLRTTRCFPCRDMECTRVASRAMLGFRPQTAAYGGIGWILTRLRIERQATRDFINANDVKQLQRDRGTKVVITPRPINPGGGPVMEISLGGNTGRYLSFA